jgi:hypothetical protein
VAETIEVGCTLGIWYSSFEMHVLFPHVQPIIISLTISGDWSPRQLLSDQVRTKLCVSQYSLSLNGK